VTVAAVLLAAVYVAGFKLEAAVVVLMAAWKSVASLSVADM